MPVYSSAPNATEFAQSLADLNAEYNGSIPGSEIPAAFIREGSFWTLVIGMLAMGMTTDPMQMLKYLKKPVGPLIEVLCQFLIMPCITMIAITVVDFASYETLAIMLYGTAPGGGISNIIIYWMDGDLDLSITMTMVSCILALGFTPLWLLVVPKLVPGESFEVPITDILINLATVVGPALVGTLLFWLGKRYNFAKIVEIISKIIAAVTTILLIVLVICGSLKYQATAIITTAQIAYAFILPLLGYVIAHLLSWLIGSTVAKRFGFGHEQYVTIGVETSVQNGRMVNAITQIVYANNPYAMAQTFFFPFLAFGAQVAYGFLASVGFQIYKKTRHAPQESANENLGEKPLPMKSQNGVQNAAFQSED